MRNEGNLRLQFISVSVAKVLKTFATVLKGPHKLQKPQPLENLVSHD